MVKRKKKKSGKIDKNLIEGRYLEYGEVDLKSLYAEEAEKKEKRRQEMWNSIDVAIRTKNGTIERLMAGLYNKALGIAAKEYFQAINRLDVAKGRKKTDKKEMDECEKDLRTVRAYYVLFVIDSIDTGMGAPYKDILDALNNIAGREDKMKFTEEMLDVVLDVTQSRGTTYEKHPKMYKMT